MSKTIITHPDNAHLIQDAYRKATGESSFWALPIKTNPHMERFGPAKRIRLPDGTVVDREKFVLKTRFVNYGPEDLRWLMWAGTIQEQLEPLFYLIDDSVFRVFMDYGRSLFSQRAAVYGGTYD